MTMRCVDLTDVEKRLPNSLFDYLSRVDHIYISSKIESVDRIDFLKSLGVTKVIDLKCRDEVDFNDEKEFLGVGIEYKNIPISGVCDFTQKNIQEFSELIKNSKGKILLYCKSGNRAVALLTLNSCLVCGHPKKRALEIREKLDFENTDLQKSVKQIIENGRLDN